MDRSGDLVFLEPFETQKNVSSFNYGFRDYLVAVLDSERTAVSEGYISHDEQRTQIITVASPIFDETGKLCKVFAASVSDVTLRRAVFGSLRARLASNDDTTFYLLDRHGHVVAASGGSGGYRPRVNATTDVSDQGNVRDSGTLKMLKWQDDRFEAGNSWERATQSWVPASLDEYYSQEYTRSDGVRVVGTLHPVSILATDRKWAILIETPASQLSSSTARMREVLFGSAATLSCVLCFATYMLRLETGRTSAGLASQQTASRELEASVAHDIRSPLLQLEVLLTTMNSLPDKTRMPLLRAIDKLRFIADDLSRPVRLEAIEPAEGSKAGEATIELMPRLVASIVTQKRLEHERRSAVRIDYQFDNGAYGLFARVVPSVVSRVLSNVINNAVESIAANGHVRVRLSESGDDIAISVSDDGCGIRPDLLPHIFERGVSSKPNGKGLGLFLAREAMNAAGGSIEARPNTGSGTTVLLRLPRVAQPGWFCRSIEVSSAAYVVVADDDVSIHEVWGRRLSELQNGANRVPVHHYQSPEDLREKLGGLGDIRGGVFLIDFEFKTSPVDGIALIQELSLGNRSVLVTSHDDDSVVRDRAMSLGVVIVPKALAGYVPLT
jgi:signal transduction histidine kinase